jgi:hypothetical protein
MLLDSVSISPRVPIFDLKIAPFDPTRISHAQPKRSDTGVRFWIIFGDPKQYANPPQSFGLLRSQCKRPCGRRTNKRDEIAPPHCLPRGSDRASYRVKLAGWKWSKRRAAMSALGQKRTSELVQSMSALPPKADITKRSEHVRPHDPFTLVLTLPLF